MKKREWSIVWMIWAMIFGVLYSGSSEAAVRDNIYDILSIKDLSGDECMIYNAYHESRSEADIANLLVMASVVNRIKSPRWGSNPCEVILQKYQYSWVRDGKGDYPQEKGQFYRMQNLLDFFWKNLDTILVMSEGADMYHHKDIKPEWDWSQLDYIGQSDNHLFYKHK
ncbi:TMhelix containing protein [Vibrio phage 1.187.O._10N.286.49.F1]|nr:TMhelix containing protein [Vibrio phage 1.187.O._10N.286.49.F1]